MHSAEALKVSKDLTIPSQFLPSSDAAAWLFEGKEVAGAALGIPTSWCKCECKSQNTYWN